MRILSMTASFGRLHETLDLRDGLNLLQLPNESGKSTWCAFLLAMLYGIDTNQRKTKDNPLPEKTRYLPWDGSPLEGTMQIEWEGRQITLERTSTARVPFGSLKAYDTQTGRPVPELTADNCGQVLLGVERSVFERTAFLRQSGMSISTDAALEQRLNALITTGDESLAASELEKKLKELNNALSGRSGRIGRVKSEIQNINDTLRSAEKLVQGIKQLRADHRQKEQEQTIWEQRLAQHERAERYRQSLRARQAEEQLASARKEKDDLERELASLPTEAKLAQWKSRLATLMAQAEEADEALPEAAPLPETLSVFRGMTVEQAREMVQHDLAACRAQRTEPTLELPPAFRGMSAERFREAISEARRELSETQHPEREYPAIFHGKSAEEAVSLAQADAEECRRLRENKVPSILPAVAAILLTVGGAGLTAVSLPVGIALAAVGGAASVLLAWRWRKGLNAAQEAAGAERRILSKYGADTAEELSHLAQRYAEALRSARQRRELILLRFGASDEDGLEQLALRWAAEEEQQARLAEQASAMRQSILRRYRVQHEDELPERVAQYAACMDNTALIDAQRAQAETAIREKQQQRQQALSQLLEEAQPFAPCRSAADVQALISRTELTRQAFANAVQALENAETHRAALGEANAPYAEAPAEDRAVCADQAAVLRRQVETIANDLSQQKGRLEALCDPAELASHREELTAELAALEERAAVVQTAMRHLQSANERLQDRFAPKIAEQAGAIFNRLTEGRYARLVLAEDLTAQTEQSSSTILRPMQALSCGTVDQLYLSVRLAMVNLLLGDDVPLVLDDALVNFDDRRAALALELLQELAGTRQILLFTCHGREKRMMS